MSNRDNIQRYRDRKEAEGYRRVEILLSKEACAELFAIKKPWETWGETVERLISGNRHHE